MPLSRLYTNQMKIAVIATSPRKNSNTLRFCRYVRHILNELGQDDVTVIDFEQYDIPLIVHGKVHKDSLTPFQQQFITAWEEADLVLFATPEYNWTASAELINTFHQLGGKDFAHLFDNKTFAIAGISSGRGGREPILQMTTVLNKLINFLNGNSIVSARGYESHETGHNLTEDGLPHGHNPIYEKTARAFVEYTLQIAQRWHAATLVEAK